MVLYQILDGLFSTPFADFPPGFVDSIRIDGLFLSPTKVIYKDTEWYSRLDNMLKQAQPGSSLCILLVAEQNEAQWVGLDPVWAVFRGLSPPQLQLVYLSRELLSRRRTRRELQLVRVSQDLCRHLDDVSRRKGIAGSSVGSEAIFVSPDFGHIHQHAYTLLRTIVEDFDRMPFKISQAL